MDSAQQRLAAQLLSRPALIVVYGDTALGKTVDKLYTFPRGIHIAGWGALRPAVSTVGYVPTATIEVKPDDMLLARLREEVKRARDKHKDADSVVIDDLSVVISRSARVMATGKYRDKDARRLYGELGIAFGAAVDEWSSYGLHCVCDCHAVPAKYEEEEGKPEPKGTLLKLGGPGLGGAMGPALVKVSTMTYHAVVDPMRRPWPLSYRAGPLNGHHLWLSKDRENVVRGSGPANLREIMHEVVRRYEAEYKTAAPATWKIARPPGWEWHEEYVEWAAAAILGGHPESTVLSHVAKTVLPENGKQGTGPFALRWIVRDALARVELRRMDQLSDLRSMGISV